MAVDLLDSLAELEDLNLLQFLVCEESLLHDVFALFQILNSIDVSGHLRLSINQLAVGVVNLGEPSDPLFRE